LESLKSYLGRLNLDDFSLDEYIKKIECDDSKIPTIGMAISGGGWSSGFTGTGALRAFDDRFAPSVEQSVDRQHFPNSDGLNCDVNVGELEAYCSL
jgi:lysophospholipase